MHNILLQRVKYAAISGKYSDQAIAKAHNLTVQQVVDIRLGNINTMSDPETRKTKLTFEQAQEIRRLYNQNILNQNQLAADFNVSKGLIYCIIQNRTYIDNNYTPPKKQNFYPTKKSHLLRTEEFCTKVRQDYVTGKFTYNRLANKHGCSPDTISKIIKAPEQPDDDELTIECRRVAFKRSGR